MLTPKTIKSLYKLENEIKKLKNYKNVCLATYKSRECDPENSMISITKLFNNPS